MHRSNLLDFNQAALARYFTDLGEKPFRARQVMQWIHQFGVDDVGAMTNLSRKLRAQLTETACIRVPEVVSEQIAADGTRKWLLKLECGNCIETVYIPELGRGTLCVSSQVGCPLRCSFCATAMQGYNRNLSVAEIIGQVWLARQRLDQFSRDKPSITNVVMMGMGEPLLNFDNVVAAMDLMMDDLAYGLGRKRVTLSTAGLVPMIDKLKEVSPVSLAISLHAPNDELRDELVPINRKYPIASLLDACRRYAEHQSVKSVITFEYIMLGGVNDSIACAKELVRRLRGLPAKVNLIPFNAIPGAPYQCSDTMNINRFREILCRAGYVTVTRKVRGADIDAACGQLAGKVLAKGRRLLPTRPTKPMNSAAEIRV